MKEKDTAVIYQHYRGGLYEYVCSAISVANSEHMVVYKSMETETVYVRNSLVFHEKFKRISPTEM